MLRFTFFLVALCFLAVHSETVSLELQAKIQAAINALPEVMIPEVFKLQKPRDNTHWCCRVDIPDTMVQQTRVQSFTSTNSENYRCGSRKCGFAGWKKCGVYCDRYWTDTHYFIEHYSYNQGTECPEDHLICCVNYILIQGQCFHIDEIVGNTGLLAALNNQGLIGVGK